MQHQIIVNPTAGSGKAARKAQILGERLGAEFMETTHAGHAVQLARAACQQGVDILVVVGGDGTFSEVTEGIMTRFRGDNCPAICIVPAGTGGDYRRTFKMSESVDSAIERLHADKRRRVDIGLATFYSQQGLAQRQHFLNVCSVGLGGLTDQIVENSPKWLGGRAAFFLGASRAALAHTPVPIELSIDGRLIEVAPFSNIAICLGRYFGGGMKIAPDAQPDDGLFEIITIEGSALKNLSLAASIYQGSHLHSRGVKHYRGSQVKALSTRRPTPLIDLDGEQPGCLPLEVSLQPQALQLLL